MRTFVIACTFALAASACKKTGQDSKPSTGTSAVTAPAPASAPAPSPATPAAAPTAQEVTVTTSSPEAAAAFRKGRELVENARGSEAIADFQRAVELDPKFALARAYLGTGMPGAEGDGHLAKAVRHAQKLPEPERTVIESMRAFREGELAKATELRRKVAALVPADWRAQQTVAGFALDDQRFDEAAAAARKAIALNPNAAEPYNLVGYAFAQQGQFDDGIAALKKYASMRPEQPNPQDSLGEVLLMAGRHEEAEAAFRKAVSIAPAFGIAWQGVAITQFLRGNWAGGRDALAKVKDAAVRPGEKFEADVDLSLSFLAEGKHADALRVLDAAEKEAVEVKHFSGQIWGPFNRALIFLDQKKTKEAMEQLAVAFERAKSPAFPGIDRAFFQVFGNVRRSLALLELRQVAEAEKGVAEIEQAAQKADSNKNFQSALHLARGAVAFAKKDLPGAIRDFAQCQDSDMLCLRLRMTAQQESRDKAGAEATRQKILKPNRRDLVYVYVRQKLAATTGK